MRHGTRLRPPLHAALAAACLLPVSGAGPQEAETAPDLGRALVETLAEGGVHLAPEAGFVAVDAEVVVRRDLLEYLLVGPGGALHESLFQTDASPSLLNAGLLALGARAGNNAEWIAVEPPPTLEERRAGQPTHDVRSPEGDGFYLYATWQEGDELYLYRVEDLVANLHDDRSMRRHRWVYLGSRFAPLGEEPEVFVADVEQNLVNVTFFPEGNTLITAALPECIDQSIWIANPWLVPERGALVLVVFSRERLDGAGDLPAAWLERLRSFDAAPKNDGDEGDDGSEGG